MRQKIITSFVIVLLCNTFLVVVSDTARAPQDGDYTYSVKSGIATITNYTGVGSDITIPSSLGGHQTGVIGDQAFFHCDSLLSVTIPDDVTTIGTRAFASCSSLTSVTIGSGVTTIATDMLADSVSITAIDVDEANVHYASINGVLYDKAITTVIQYPHGKVGAFSIPSSITTIAKSSFFGCPALTSVAIPSSVTIIEDNAFDSCITLTSITLLGLASPTTVGSNWIQSTPAGIRGHAYATSNFPDPGDTWNGLTMGAYITAGTPPVFGLPSPANGSTGNPLSLSWNIRINDPEGNTYSWTIQCSNHQTNSATNTTNGTKSLSLSGLTYSTTYKIWVNATDPTGSDRYTRGWYTFTTVTSSGNPSNLNAQNPTSSSISLSWTKGSTSDYTMIRRSTSGYPTSATSGTQAYYGTGTSATDSSLSSGQIYYYRAWAYSSSSGQYSSGYASDSEYTSPGTPSSLNAYTPTTNSISLSWSKGTAGEYTMIRRSTGIYPSSPTSGTQAYYGTETSATDSGLSPGTYYYRAWARDSDSNYYSSEYSQDYETISQPINSPPAFGMPSPANLSTNNPISLTWSIPINDPEGNTFSWTIQCSNHQTNSATNTTNGTKSLSLSGLTYSTTYKIWVNATDPTGSGNYTRNWYTFTTKNSSDGDGGGSDGAEIPNKKPIANASAGAPYQGFVNIEILFDGSASYDPDGTITKYEWSFGDNTTATEATPTHTYQKEGNYTVTLTVTDNNGNTSQNTTYALIMIKQNHPPTQPHLTGPTQGTLTTQYNLIIYATDPDNDNIHYTIHWSDDTNITITDFVPNGTTIPVTHQWTKPGIYIIKAYTTDRNNATSETIELTVLINIHFVTTIGYLIDTQNNGTYDIFYSNTTGNSTLTQHNNNNYLIDTDEDGNPDHQYNIVTGEMNSYSAEQPTNNPLPSNLVIILVALAVIIIITLALVANIQRKKQLLEKTTPKEADDYLNNQPKIDTPKITNVLFNEIQQKIDQLNPADVLVNEIQPKVDISEIANYQEKEISQKIDVQKITDPHFMEIEQKIDTSKIIDEQVKEIHQKIDELLINDKKSNTQ